MTVCFATHRYIHNICTFLPEPCLIYLFVLFFGWFKRSLNQSIGSLSCNPHFGLFQPDRRWDIFRNASDHWGMVTYNFFWNFFFRSLIRACTGSFANVLEALWPVSIKLGQIWVVKKQVIGPSWCTYLFFLGSLIRTCTGSWEKNCVTQILKLGQILCCQKKGDGS